MHEKAFITSENIFHVLYDLNTKTKHQRFITFKNSLFSTGKIHHTSITLLCAPPIQDVCNNQSFSSLKKIACARAQIFSSLALSLRNKRAPLNLELIFKRFFEVFMPELILFLIFWRSFQKSTFKAKK